MGRLPPGRPPEERTAVANGGGEPYVVSTWLDKYLFSAMTTTPLRAALWGVLMVAVCWLTTYPLYRRKIFIKL